MRIYIDIYKVPTAVSCSYLCNWKIDAEKKIARLLCSGVVQQRWPYKLYDKNITANSLPPSPNMNIIPLSCCKLYIIYSTSGCSRKIRYRFKLISASDLHCKHNLRIRKYCIRPILSYRNVIVFIINSIRSTPYNGR